MPPPPAPSASPPAQPAAERPAKASVRPNRPPRAGARGAVPRSSRSARKCAATADAAVAARSRREERRPIVHAVTDAHRRQLVRQLASMTQLGPSRARSPSPRPKSSGAAADSTSPALGGRTRGSGATDVDILVVSGVRDARVITVREPRRSVRACDDDDAAATTVAAALGDTALGAAFGGDAPRPQTVPLPPNQARSYRRAPSPLASRAVAQAGTDTSLLSATDFACLRGVAAGGPVSLDDARCPLADVAANGARQQPTGAKRAAGALLSAEPSDERKPPGAGRGGGRATAARASRRTDRAARPPSRPDGAPAVVTHGEDKARRTVAAGARPDTPRALVSPPADGMHAELAARAAVKASRRRADARERAPLARAWGRPASGGGASAPAQFAFVAWGDQTDASGPNRPDLAVSARDYAASTRARVFPTADGPAPLAERPRRPGVAGRCSSDLQRACAGRRPVTSSCPATLLSVEDLDGTGEAQLLIARADETLEAVLHKSRAAADETEIRDLLAHAEIRGLPAGTVDCVNIG